MGKVKSGKQKQRPSSKMPAAQSRVSGSSSECESKDEYPCVLCNPDWGDRIQGGSSAFAYENCPEEKKPPRCPCSECKAPEKCKKGWNWDLSKYGDIQEIHDKMAVVLDGSDVTEAQLTLEYFLLMHCLAKPASALYDSSCPVGEIERRVEEVLDDSIGQWKSSKYDGFYQKAVGLYPNWPIIKGDPSYNSPVRDFFTAGLKLLRAGYKKYKGNDEALGLYFHKSGVFGGTKGYGRRLASTNDAGYVDYILKAQQQKEAEKELKAVPDVVLAWEHPDVIEKWEPIQVDRAFDAVNLLNVLRGNLKIGQILVGKVGGKADQRIKYKITEIEGWQEPTAEKPKPMQSKALYSLVKQ